MERFIREKYQHKTLCGEGRPLPSIKHNTGSSSGSSNDIPPPVPAKNAPRLTSSLRSSSAMYPQTSSALPSPPASDFSNSSRRMAGIPEDGPTSRDHSFEGRTVNGNLGSDFPTATPFAESHRSVNSNAQQSYQSNGISFDAPTTSPNPIGVGSTNSAVSHAQTASNSSNPFLRMQPTSSGNSFQQPQPLQTNGFEQSFQNMSISQPQTQQQTQPLFPNNTGSFSTQRPHAPDLQNNPFLKTFTPPISPSPSIYNNPPQQQQQPIHNPFLRTSQSQHFASSNPFGGTQQPAQPTSQPFNWAQPQPPASQQPHYQPLQQPQNQQNFFQQSMVQSPTSQISSSATQTNISAQLQQQPQPQPPVQVNGPDHFVQQQPYQTQQQSFGYSQIQPQLPQQQQQQTYQQPFFQQQQPRPFQDKSSILALYNNNPNPYVQNAQQQPLPLSQQQQPTQAQAYQQPQTQAHPPPQRSVTMPVMPNSSNNPFGAVAPTANQPVTGGIGHVSRESMAFTGGRSASPDAFSGLSARYG